MRDGEYRVRQDSRNKADLTWKAQGACSGMDPSLWFPDGTQPAKGVSVCWVCPVKAECLEFGLREEHGVWGGLDPQQRRRVLRHRLVSTRKERMVQKAQAS